MTDTARKLKVPAVGDGIRMWWAGLSRPTQWAVGVPFIILIALLPILDPPIISTPGTDFGGVMAEFGRLALIAIGLNVVVGQAGLLDLGYVGFYAVGAYTVALATSPDSTIATDMPWLVAVPIAMVITAVTGLILGLPTLRLRGDYLAIVTLGFGELVRLLADNVGPLRGQPGFKSVEFPHVLAERDGREVDLFSTANSTPPFTSGVLWFWLSIAFIIVILILVGNLERSRVGRAWVAIREDEDAAEIMGVPTFRFKLWAFVMGAAIGGLSGALLAGQVQFVNNQNATVVQSVLFLCAVVLGGQGNKLGVILGAFIIVYIPNRFLEIAEYKYLIFGLALIVLMIFRPQGVIPARQKLLARAKTPPVKRVPQKDPAAAEMEGEM